MTAPLIKDCKRLMDLEPGWDGYHGKPVTGSAIVTVLSGQVVPGADGGVQIEWHTEEGSVEIEIDADGKLLSVSWVKSQ